MESPVAGFLVHLAISIFIGSSYGLLFYRKASSYAAELALGLVYGWFWWVFGAVTLFALLLRQPVDWSPQAVTFLYPSLIGHLLYGAGLAIFFQFLTRRYDAVALGRARRIRQPTDTAAQARQTQPTAVPVWIVILVLGVVLPLLIWTGGRGLEGGY